MIKEIVYGLAGNFIFSLILFSYKRYHHEHYDEIIKKIILIETQLKPLTKLVFDDCLRQANKFAENIKECEQSELSEANEKLKISRLGNNNIKPINNDNINKKIFLTYNI